MNLGRVGPVLRNAALAAADLAYACSLQARTLTLALRPAGLTESADPDARPVLLLPGVYESWRFLTPLITQIEQLGHPIHMLPELGHNLHPVTEAASIAADYLHHHELEGVTVVAHSKGGLIGKSLMLGPHGRRVDRMLAIATPFTGSSWARYAPARHLRAFSPTDAYTLQLARNAAVDARITSVSPRHDPLIPSGSTLPGATNIALDVDGHFLVLRSTELAAVLSRYLSA